MRSATVSSLLFYDCCNNRDFPCRNDIVSTLIAVEQIALSLCLQRNRVQSKKTTIYCLTSTIHPSRPTLKTSEPSHQVTNMLNGCPVSSLHIISTRKSLVRHSIGSPVTAKNNNTDVQGFEGYVQGMSDLCAPIYIVMGADQEMTFWCFVQVMDRMVRELINVLIFSLSKVPASRKKIFSGTRVA